MTPEKLFALLREHGLVPPDAVFAHLSTAELNALRAVLRELRSEFRLDFMTNPAGL